ncbi:hypothetical protein HUJ04_011023 [Dendroctonus ponderosae]|nr:hypothetical protein HUJ04_011023 [Dendroctonus ponderosae]
MPISDDANDFLPLTPFHFLIGDSLASHAEEDVTHLNPARLNRYQHLLQLYQQFWKRWSREYLTSLQVRTKWKAGTENPVKIGSLVILMEDNTPPLKWPLARVIELYPGTDNIVRVVSVRLPNGTIVRRTLSKIQNGPEKAHICKMKKEKGEMVTEKDIVATIQNYYLKLCSSSISKPENMEENNAMNLASDELVIRKK